MWPKQKIQQQKNGFFLLNSFEYLHPKLQINANRTIKPDPSLLHGLPPHRSNTISMPIPLLHSLRLLPTPPLPFPLPPFWRRQPPRWAWRRRRRRTGPGPCRQDGSRARARVLEAGVGRCMGLHVEIKGLAPHGPIRRRFRHERVDEGTHWVDSLGIGRRKVCLGCTKLPKCTHRLQVTLPQATRSVCPIGMRTTSFP